MSLKGKIVNYLGNTACFVFDERNYILFVLFVVNCGEAFVQHGNQDFAGKVKLSSINPESTSRAFRCGILTATFRER